LSTRLKEKYEKLQQTIKILSEESAKGTLIVVEGKKDQEALRSLEINGPILTAKTGGKTFTETTHAITKTNPKEVILLMDFDRRGKEGIKRLKQDLEKNRITPNLKFWQDLKALLSREVQCIESLPAYLQTLQEKTEPL
jgi:2,5-diamino-6-(ribosylamino)-4(3H)-pyrimidinone 5'-phosphate reductase